MRGEPSSLALSWRWVFCVVLSALLLAAGCAWEGDGSTVPDSGIDDGGGGSGYPPPPYGSDYGDTVENFRVEEALCDVNPPMTRALYAEAFLGAPVTLVSVHAGWCTYCKQQAAGMEDMYQKYKQEGLRILLVLFEDEQGSSDHDKLLEYTCSYRDRYGMTFTLAIDPSAEVMDQFFRPTEAGTPLNMLLDKDMTIRFKLEGVIPDTLEGNIEALLSEG